MADKIFKMDNLRKIREQKNLTQIKVSVDLEVSQELISHYEIGTIRPNIDTLIKLADYFNCSTDYLLNRTNIPTTIKFLNKDDINNNEIINKYNSLSNKDKAEFNNFLNFLCNKKK